MRNSSLYNIIHSQFNKFTSRNYNCTVETTKGMSYFRRNNYGDNFDYFIKILRHHDMTYRWGRGRDYGNHYIYYYLDSRRLIKKNLIFLRNIIKEILNV